MKRLLLSLLLLAASFSYPAVAQRLGGALGGGGETPPLPPARWQEHADSLFQFIDRSQVETGLLANYGFAFKDYAPFQGTALTSANRLLHLGEWRLLYGAMQTSAFNANAALLPLSAANLRIRQAQQQSAPGVVSIATLFARYDRFTDDAGTAGLITVGNGQLHDAPNRPRSPYEQRTLLALCPLTSQTTSGTVQFLLPARLLFTNAAPAITALEFDAGEGQGYRPAAWDQLLSVTYATNGSYTLRFRLTCADGAVLLSQARFDVNQPPASRYGAEDPRFPNPNVLTRPTSALFTDTRAYNSPNGFYAATGRVTVALSANNATGTILKPLIVIEGYDASTVLLANGLSPRDIQDYDYNYFVRRNDFGAILTLYNPSNPGDRTNFNDQLSEVGNYDLIFLNFDNGTDYIQRNAFLVERLIQWVNDNKGLVPGQTIPEHNIVMGMSMGGLVARYALSDMEQRQASTGIAHDTRLYISHEAPHQGANVPLGVQHMVSSLANTRLVPGLTVGDLVVQLGAFNKLLNEPATQQLLIYQTSAAGTNLHNAWLADYNGRGYPTLCRNVATSDGSECGRPQAFLPYAELLNIQGNGLLNEPYNGYANSAALGLGIVGGVLLLGGIDLITGVAVGAAVATGNFEGHADFVVNALPSQQAQRIYHGKVYVTKDILFGLFTTRLVIYSENRNSEAYMLPYDSAPGGVYDLDQVAPGFTTLIGGNPVLPVTIRVQPRFDFVPTTSALDIGGGTVALRPQDLTNTYSGAGPPAAPFNTPFANFVTAGRENQTHLLWTGLNSKWAFQEMQGLGRTFNCLAFCQAMPTISGASGTDAICANIGRTLSVNLPPNLPANTTVGWMVEPPTGLVTYSSSGTSITLFPVDVNVSGQVKVTATVNSECGQFALTAILVPVGIPASPATLGPDWGNDCGPVSKQCRIDNYDPHASYVINVSGALSLVGTGVQPNGTYSVRSGPVGGATGHIEITAHNSCGTSSVSALDVITPCGDNGFAATIYPNPARESVNVHFTRGHADAAHPVTVRLYDGYGQLRAEQTSTSAATMRLRTIQFPTGLYFVHILYGGQVLIRQQLRIEQ